MYLKRLQLHGFKSFATRTSLEFSPGITAIVGPNGSGKSNVADGLRWVLGEQSMRHLRGKKSEDIIFAGGHGRAALGMAEVTLTLDNSSNWLPSDYSEVTVTRRVFRSGDSDYLINGAKVRLKDVLNLLSQARIGHDSYTIIGQGLVDQALSSRAEERRSLFEDAAGIRHFQAQRNDAEQRLALTHTNLSRLHDILSEIEPRLGPLAEQARRARDFITARADLDRMQRQWFGFQWRSSQEKVQLAEQAETAAQARVDELRDALSGHEGAQQEARSRRNEIIAVIAELRRQRGETLSRVQTLERDRAVAQERAASMERQRKELDGEQGRVNWALTEAEQRITQMEADLLAIEAEIEAGQAGIAELESQGHRAKQEQERAEARLRAAQRDAMQAQAKLAAAQAEIGRLSKQRAEREAALAARREAAAQSAERAAAAQARLDALREAHETQRAILGDKLVEREHLSQTIAAEQAALETRRSELADAQRERRALADRLALLREWAAGQRDSAAALAVLESIPEDERPQMLGTLAQLAQSAPEYETAFEAALGPFLHAIVAASEDDAWRAASLLHGTDAGRVTILWPVEHNNGYHDTSGNQSDHVMLQQGNHKGLPLQTNAENAAMNGAGDGQRSPNGLHAATVSRHSMPATNRAGAAHHASGHVKAQTVLRLVDLLHPEVAPEVAQVIRGIVGQMALIAEEEPATARWQVQSAPVVTAGGMVAHPAGWLAVGRAQTDAAEGVLARSRELRELPAQIDAADERIHEQEGLLANARAALEDDRAALAALEREIKTLEAQLSEGSKALGQAQREAERLNNEAQLGEAVAEQLAAEMLTLANDLATVEVRVAEAQAAHRDAADMLESIQEDAEAALEESRIQQEDLARRRTALAVQQQRYQAAKAQLAQARAQADDLAAQMQRRTARLAELAQEAEALLATMAMQGAELEAQRAILRDLSAQLHEQEAQAAQIEQQISHLEAAQAAERVALAQAEEELRRAMLEAQRARDAMDVLRNQMVEEMSEEDAQAVINRLAEGAPEEIPPPEELVRLRRQIDSLRGRMKSLGGYDPEAPQAYEELKTRYEFLTAQVRDMEEASARLRAVIMELDATMKRRFEETFQAVNERFRQHFVTLFQGGAARLELTTPKRGRREEDDEDDAEEEPAEAPPTKRAALAGVEIFVQIPGKKVQELNLLSGGERAMVSAALLFALLETNPPPFCLLDEVDAALDESNVVRFCEILNTLAHQTQFIVITHNRVTMTHANVIYGVSMTESVSRILSMRLAEVPAP